MSTNELILFYVFIAIGAIYSIIIHEVAHGLVAKNLGDDTASVMGRLTFNPLAHIDIFGTIVLPVLLIIMHLPAFGYAKPVPVNPNKMANPNSDYFIVALAGPISNFFIALVLGLLVRFFNFPLIIEEILFSLIAINLVLMIFNLIPIPPLDGSKVLGLFLPQESLFVLQQVGMIVLFGLIIFSSSIPVIPYILNHVVGFFFTLITGHQVMI